MNGPLAAGVIATIQRSFVPDAPGLWLDLVLDATADRLAVEVVLAEIGVGFGRSLLGVNPAGEVRMGFVRAHSDRPRAADAGGLPSRAAAGYSGCQLLAFIVLLRLVLGRVQLSAPLGTLELWLQVPNPSRALRWQGRVHLRSSGSARCRDTRGGRHQKGGRRRRLAVRRQAAGHRRDGRGDHDDRRWVQALGDHQCTWRKS